MRNLIKQILKEEQEWFDELKPMEVYVPWVEDAIDGFEEWETIAYQKGDEIDLVINELKTNPSKNAIENAINVIERWHGQAYEVGDDFDWALGSLKMSIDPYSWKRFNVFGSTQK